jgi:spore coat protein U-like protein
VNASKLARCSGALWALLGAGCAVAGCTVSSSGLSFGGYQPLTFGSELRSSESIGVTTVTLACTGIATSASYSMALGPSPTGNSISPRYLANAGGGPPMAFNVYQDPAYTTVWGDGSAGALITGTLPVGDSTRNHSAYGRVPPGQNTLARGTFSATLVITLTYSP